jgi:hypothetical protein
MSISSLAQILPTYHFYTVSFAQKYRIETNQGTAYRHRVLALAPERGSYGLDRII